MLILSIENLHILFVMNFFALILIFKNVALNFYSWLLIFFVLVWFFWCCLIFCSRQVSHTSYPWPSSSGIKLYPYPTINKHVTRVCNDTLACKHSFKASLPVATATPLMKLLPLFLSHNCARGSSSHILPHMIICLLSLCLSSLWVLWGQRWSLFHLCTHSALCSIGFIEDT